MGETGEVFLARQPILDRHDRIAAYEILYRDSAIAQEAHIDDPSRTSARVLIDVFSSLDAGSVLGSRLGFFNVNEEILASDVIESLPRERVVLEILETVEFTPRLMARCHQLRKRGFQLALDDFVADDPRTPLVDHVQYVKVDLRAVNPRDLRRTVRKLKAHPVQILAEKVESREEFESCRDLGFDLFQGFYFARPAMVRGNTLDPSRSTVVELLQMLAREAPISELSATFKLHVNLGVTLLRLMNSVGLARRQKIQTVEHALVLLGRNRLRRWLALLLFAVGETGSTTRSLLLQTAAMRGRLLELLVGELEDGGEDGAERENRAFLAGMLSLADALLGVSRSDLVASLHLEAEIEQALVAGTGLFGELLSLTESVEQADFADLATRLSRLGMSPETFAAAELAAYQWSSAIDQAIADAS